MLAEFKGKLGGCSNPNCEESDVCCLDFHHVQFPKRGRIDRVLSRARFLEEAEKCTILCKNCHAKVHAGHLKLVLTPLSADVLESNLPMYGRKRYGTLDTIQEWDWSGYHATARKAVAA